MATVPNKGSLLYAMMRLQLLGLSTNKRDIQGGVVKVNDVTVTDLDFPVRPGDVIKLGRRQVWTISETDWIDWA